MNQLNVSLQHSIATLAVKGWSAPKIARELGIRPPGSLAPPGDPQTESGQAKRTHVTLDLNESGRGQSDLRREKSSPINDQTPPTYGF